MAFCIDLDAFRKDSWPSHGAVLPLVSRGNPEQSADLQSHGIYTPVPFG
jgi:hypothetical protein